MLCHDPEGSVCEECRANTCEVKDLRQVYVLPKAIANVDNQTENPAGGNFEYTVEPHYKSSLGTGDL